MKWFTVTILICLIVGIHCLDFELHGPLEKTIKQTEAQEYEEDGWKLSEGSEKNLKVDYNLPIELTRGIVNTDPGYTIVYNLKDSSNKIIATRTRVVKVEDVNECELQTHNCHKNADCINTIGSYTCKCRKGFTDVSKGEPGRVCIPNDECAKNAHLCPPHSRCENREDGYVCICNDGFVMEGDRCVSVDECVKGTHKCKNADCVKTEGGYYCKCHEGFIHTRDRHVCELEDVCENGKLVCSPYAQCYLDQAENRYKCKCNSGFAGDGKTCQDINECEEGTYSCPENSYCVNTFGGYECECNEGFEKKNGKCVDIDECARNLYWCHPKAVCRNTIGSYECDCIPGYEGDGKKLCKSTEDPFIRLNNANPVRLRLGEHYIEYGYTITDPSGDELDISTVIDPQLKEKLKKCGEFKVDYHVTDPRNSSKDIPGKTRKVIVEGIDLCATNDRDLAEPCPENSRCIPDIAGCTRQCKCLPGFRLQEGVCVDAEPPVLLCPTEVNIKQCKVCDQTVGEIKVEEEMKKKRCVAYDLIYPNPVTVNNNEIQKNLNNPQKGPASVILPSGVVDLTSVITGPIEKHLNESCRIHTYSVRDQQGNEAKTDIVLCTNTVDMKDMKDEMDKMITKYEWYINFLLIAICATIAWLLLLAFGEFAKSITYFVQVVLFRDTSDYDRSTIAYGFWYRILHPFSTEKEVKSYVNQRVCFFNFIFPFCIFTNFSCY